MQKEVSQEKASQGRKEGVGRYVLAISLALVVIGFAVAYLALL
jgi:hypothetical protein